MLVVAALGVQLVDLALHSRSSRTVIDLRRVHRDPVAWGAAMAVASIFTPWLTGRIVGLRLPATALGLPWFRWLILLGAVLAVVGCAGALLLGRRWLQLVVAVGFSVVECVGILAWLVISVAAKLSRYGAVLDTVLRNYDSHANVVPAIRVGPGALLFMVAGIVGSWGAYFNVRRHFPRQDPTDSGGMPGEDEVTPGELADQDEDLRSQLFGP